jgi:hypothetical protein
LIERSSYRGPRSNPGRKLSSCSALSICSQPSGEGGSNSDTNTENIIERNNNSDRHDDIVGGVQRLGRVGQLTVNILRAAQVLSLNVRLASLK